MSCLISKKIQHIQRCQKILERRSILSKSLNTIVDRQKINKASSSQSRAQLQLQLHRHSKKTFKNVINFNDNVSFDVFSIRNAKFSTTAAKETETPTEEGQGDESTSATPTVTLKYKQSPSILTTLNENYTPGQAWSALQIHLAGKKKIRLDDFSQLCLASRASSPKDAGVILTAMKDLKRCNDFSLTTDVAEIALEGMRRSLLREGATGTPKFMVKAGVFMGEAFIDETTGLYVSAQAEVVHNMILKTLLEGVQKYESVIRDDADGSEEDVESPLTAAATSTKKVIDVLLLRASNPTSEMKKRKKRKYLKNLRCSSGPTPQIIDTAVQICLEHEDLGEGLIMAKDILEAYKERSYLGTVLEETNSLVKDKEAELAEVAAAAAVANGEDNAEEGEENVEDENK